MSTISDFKIQYGYLVYPYNEQVKDIFLKERNITKYIVEDDKGKTSPKSIDKEFRDILKDEGFILTPIEEKYLCGIRELCGYRIDVTKLADKKEIKSLLIRVSGLDDIDLSQKIKSIKEFLKSKYNLDSEKLDNFMFSKTNRC